MNDSIWTNQRIIKFTGALLALLIALAGVKLISMLKSYAYIGGGVPASTTITVSGEGEVFAAPDVATITISLRETKPSVSAAQSEIAAKANQALAFLKTEGIAEKDVKTVSYNAYPEYEYRAQDGTVCSYGCPTGKRVLVGYTVNESLAIKVRDTTKVGATLDGVAKMADPSDISGPEFSIDDPKGLEREAREKAIADAKMKADALVADLGVSLGRIVSFSEGAAAPVFYAKAAAMAEGVGAVPSVPPTLPTGENKVVSNVTITYEIR